ncbi:hypothetical protein V8E53_000775 [Lactarius tabidus]
MGRPVSTQKFRAHHPDRIPFTDGVEHSAQEASGGLDATQAADSARTNVNAPNADTADADTTDADLLELLTNNHSITTNTEQDHPEAQSAAPATPPHVEPTTSAQPPHPPQPNANTPVAPLVIDHFPHGNPGTPVPGLCQGRSGYQQSQETFGASVWAPFHSQCDWEVAHWAKMRGPSSSAMEELLAIPEVVDKLGLSFSSTKELNDIIDNVLPGRPPFVCREFVIGGETLEFYFRDILSCIRSIYSDPAFAQDLIFAPEQHYTDHERTEHVYSEMHTGDWWWAVQTTLESHRPGATVVPVIISSDKTQLTLFRGKSAYPVYLTIGNVPKDIRQKPSRRAQILVGYIPTTKLEGITNKTGRRRAVANLYHACMQLILAPITSHGETGIDMMGGDGTWRRCHPIFALFIGDYPEQVLVTCTFGGRCPKCLVPHDKLGSYNRFTPHDYNKARDAYLLADGDAYAFHSACREAGQKPVYHPFWESLPFTNVFISITPDILHQLLQGVLKHLVAWLILAFGPTVIDRQCQQLPPNHHIHIFPKGISGLSRVTGKEHKNMSRLLLGLILGLPLPSGQVSPRLISAVRALLDFLYLAQLPSHTSNTITCLDDSLCNGSLTVSPTWTSWCGLQHVLGVLGY